MHIGYWWEKRPLGRPRHRWVDNIRMDLGDGMDWIDMAQDKEQAAGKQLC
jgi:hypothetical protein